MRNELIPPLLGYYTMAGGEAAATPWYLAGGVSAADCVAAYQPKGAADYAASKVNLANPGTYNADDEDTHAPSFASGTGWTGGDGKYLLTGLVPSTALTTGMTIIARYSDAPAEGVAGILTTIPFEFKTLGFLVENGYMLYLSGDEPVVSELVTSGVCCLAGQKAYIDGVYIDDVSKSYLPGSEMQILRAPGDNLYFLGSVQAVAAYNADLTADQVAAISTAMAAL